MAFDPAKDLLSISHDYAPDYDDFQATPANQTLIQEYGVQNYVYAVGAYGKNADLVRPTVPAFTKEFFADRGIPFVDAHADYQANGNFQKSGTALGKVWEATLKKGGDVYVSEGGQSDITLVAVKYIQSQGFDPSRVSIVQHSNWNIGNTSNGVVSQLQKMGVGWSKIDDGNVPNATPDWKESIGNAEFRAAALNGKYAEDWKIGLDFFPNKKFIDFSDAVATAHILGIPTKEVSTIAKFADQYLSGDPTPPTTPPTPPMANPIVSVNTANATAAEGDIYSFDFGTDVIPTENIEVTWRIFGLSGAEFGVDFELGQGVQAQFVTASNGIQYWEGTTTLSAGQSFAGVDVQILNDSILGEQEGVRFRLASATGDGASVSTVQAEQRTILNITDTTPAPLFSLDLANTGQGGAAYDEIINGGTFELSGSQNFLGQTLIGRYNGAGSIGSMKIQTYANDVLIYNRTESAAPYTQFGDSNGNLFEGNGFSDGNYRTVLTGFSGANGSGDILGSQEFNYALTDVLA